MVEHATKFMDETKTVLQNQSEQIRSLEAQISQLAMARNSRPQGTLPSNTEVNPKEQCNAISLRTGKVLQEKRMPELLRPQRIEDPAVEKEADKRETEPMLVQPLPPSIPFSVEAQTREARQAVCKVPRCFQKAPH